MRVTRPDVEGGDVMGEWRGGCGLHEQHAVWFLKPSQVEEVCVLVELVPDSMTVCWYDGMGTEKMKNSRNVLRHVHHWSPGDNYQMIRICHTSVGSSHQSVGACDSHTIVT